MPSHYFVVPQAEWTTGGIRYTYSVYSSHAETPIEEQIQGLLRAILSLQDQVNVLSMTLQAMSRDVEWLKGQSEITRSTADDSMEWIDLDSTYVGKE